MSATAPISGKAILAGPAEALAAAGAAVEAQSWWQVRLHSPREVQRCLRQDPTLDVVVLVPGAQLEAYLELCRTIKFDSRTSFISVVCLLSPAQAERTADVFGAGADDCICTAAPPREIALRFDKALRLKRATDSLEDAAAMIRALANAVEGKDHYTCGHVERVGAYCVEIGRRVGVDGDDLAALQTGGVVHDIGKVGIPDDILNKPGKLTDDELAIMRRHPAIGFDILKPLRTFRAVLPIVRWHHERPNGTGYPDGLKGGDVPLLPRITAVADCFDALATDRPYRPAFPLPKCRQILLESGQRGELDADLVRVLFEVLDRGVAVTAGQATA